MSSISTFTSGMASSPNSDEPGRKHEFEEFLTALQSGNQSAAESAFELVKHSFQESPKLISKRTKSNGRSPSESAVR